MATFHTIDIESSPIGVKFEGKGELKRTRQLPTRWRPQRTLKGGEGLGKRSSHVVEQFRNTFRRLVAPVRYGSEYIADGSRVQ